MTKLDEIFEKSNRVEAALWRLRSEADCEDVRASIAEFMNSTGAISRAKLFDLLAIYDTKADAITELDAESVR